MAPKNILIVQTSPGCVNLCSTALKREGIDRGTHFLAFTHTIPLYDHITESRPQLLIIDSFRGELLRVKKLIKELRKINPQLVCLLVDTNVGPNDSFEDCINMMERDWDKNLARKVREFQSGTLQRKSVETNHQLQSVV